MCSVRLYPLDSPHDFLALHRRLNLHTPTNHLHRHVKIYITGFSVSLCNNSFRSFMRIARVPEVLARYFVPVRFESWFLRATLRTSSELIPIFYSESIRTVVPSKRYGFEERFSFESSSRIIGQDVRMEFWLHEMLLSIGIWWLESLDGSSRYEDNLKIDQTLKVF